MNKKVKWLLYLTGALILVFSAIKMIAESRQEGVRVTTETAERRTILKTVSASGKLCPEVEIKAGSPINGKVIQLKVHEGDSVKKGAVLAYIRADKGGITPLQVNKNIPQGFERLLQGMQARATNTTETVTITAPIGGTIIALNVKKGERTSAMQLPGSELLRIADMENLEVRVDVNKNKCIKIGIGDLANVEVEAYNKRKFKGVVTSIVNGVNKREATSFLSNEVMDYEVRIRLLPSSYQDILVGAKNNSAPFRPGMNARAEIKTQTREAVLSIPGVPVTSKPVGSEAGAKEYWDGIAGEGNPASEETASIGELAEVVYVLKDDGTVNRKAVTTGIQDINYFEITVGLKEGEQVVTGPYNALNKSLRSGRKVRTVSKEELFQTD